MRAFSRERETRENVPHFGIPVVTKTGDFLSVLQKKKKDDDDDGDLPFLLLDDDDHVLRVAVLATQRWYATTVSSGRERKRRKRKRCVRGKGRAETPWKIETRGRAEQDERHGPDGRDDRDAVLGGTTAVV